MGFSVNALFYGNHPELAVRLVDSLVETADWALIADIRFGLNEVCEATQAYLFRVAKIVPVPCLIYREVAGRNVGKYPLMRRMLHDRENLSTASHVMWFDDDSFITAKSHVWWTQAYRAAPMPGMLGSVYTIRQRGQQFKEIPKQIWYKGKPVTPSHRFRFCTGGWWVCSFDIIRQWDYPWPELHHNGGDSMLGELCRQQDYPVKAFNEGVAINADADGKESCAVRRGMQTPWLWEFGSSTSVRDNFTHVVLKPKEE